VDAEVGTVLAGAVPLPTVGEINAFLESIADGLASVLDPEPSGRGRPRVLPSLLLWGAMLLTVLERQPGQRAIWRRIADLGALGLRPLAICDQTVYTRLEREGTAPLERFFTVVSTTLAQRVQPWARRELAPFASGVYALDETTLDPLVRALTDPTTGERTRRMPGKLAGCFNLRTQLWERLIRIPDATQNERVAARDLILGLERGSLLLFDLGYFAFRWFDDLTQDGYHYISRWRKQTSYEVVHTYWSDGDAFDGDAFDGLVWLGAYRADRAAEVVRLVTFRHHGHLQRYLTNVLDPAVLSPSDIASLYARRWDIELAIKLVKTHLRLSLWWSSKDVVIEQQLWATLTIAQILQAMRLEIAGRAAVDPFDVSMAMLVEQLPQYAARGWDPIATFVERGPRMEYIRPSRRTRIVVEGFDLAAYAPRPPGLCLTRSPRYAERKSLPRSA
jgi:hypothetical protein